MDADADATAVPALRFLTAVNAILRHKCPLGANSGFLTFCGLHGTVLRLFRQLCRVTLLEIKFLPLQAFDLWHCPKYRDPGRTGPPPNVSKMVRNEFEKNVISLGLAENVV